MRKKTIKFYFFNKNIKNPAISYLFGLSKRSIKQNRGLIRLKAKLINIKSKKKKTELITYAMRYKNMIRYKLKLNQWQINVTKIKQLFMHSFFLARWISKDAKMLWKSKPAKYLYFLLWFFFKERFNKFTLKFLKKYLKIGFLSSHFVHIFSKKNLVYQARSKYRSQTHNLLSINNYVSRESNKITNYAKLLNSLLYVFTSNSAKQNVWKDEDYNIHIESWTVNHKKKTSNLYNIHQFKFPTSTELDNQTFLDIYLHESLIQTYLNTDEPKIREHTNKELSEKLGTHFLNHVHLFGVLFTLKNNSEYVLNNFIIKDILKNYIIIHNLLYRKISINNSDI